MSLRISYFVALLLTLLVGCSHSSSTSGPRKVDLGVVNLSYDAPSKHDIGNGLSVEISAGSLNSKTQCELIVKFEKGSKVLDAQRNVPAQLDQPAHFAIEDAEVTFTPHIGQ